VTPRLRKTCKILGWTLGLLLGLALVVAGWGWWRMHGSLAVLDGDVKVAGLAAPVKIERDALGVPTITGASRADVARALSSPNFLARLRSPTMNRTGSMISATWRKKPSP